MERYSVRCNQRFALCFVAALLGCSDSGYDVAPATGKVLIDGHPLTAAKVLFTPIAGEAGPKAGKAGLGSLEDDGSFAVSTYGRLDGAVVADHRVTIIDRKDQSSTGRRLGVRRVQLPNTYAVVAGQDNEFTIELTADLIRRHASR